MNGTTCRHPDLPIVWPRDKITVDGQPLSASDRIYVMLNKPRGLVTTASDEQGRATAFECFKGSFDQQHLFAVGRLDKASEGLLLFTNDTAWADAITSPATHLPKIYHVQVNRVIAPTDLDALSQPVQDQDETLHVRQLRCLRTGEKNSWLEFVLDEGRNRHLRRYCKGHQLDVLRLVRVQIGSLTLGDLPKSSWRHLTPGEVNALSVQAGLATRQSAHKR